MNDEFLDIKRLSDRSCLCERNLRAFLKGPDPIPHYRVGGKVLVRWAEFLAWMSRHRVDAAGTKSRVDLLVDELTT
jgi:hypothetical protein